MNSTSPTCNSCGSWWRLPLLLAIVLAAVWFLRDRGVRESGPAAEEAKQTTLGEATSGQTVSLTIDFGRGRMTEFKPIAWREGMTVQDVTRETPRSDMQLKTVGTGQSAFLASLDGTENEGADGRNWTYSVDGKAGDRSFAVFELQPGDRVLWTFGMQQ
jgi:hypothetical protein